MARCRKCNLSPTRPGRPFCAGCMAELGDRDIAAALAMNAELTTPDDSEGAGRGLVALFRAIEYWTGDAALERNGADYSEMMGRAHRMASCEKHATNCLVAPVLSVAAQLVSPCDPDADADAARELVRAVWCVIERAFPGPKNPWRGAVLSVLFRHLALECDDDERDKLGQQVGERIPEVVDWLPGVTSETSPNPNAPGGEA